MSSNNRLQQWVVAIMATMSTAVCWAAPSQTGHTDFNRDIRPLFATHCTACHGGVKAAGKISFVYRDKALASGKSGLPAIVPGRPEDSEVIRRVTTTDPDELMPQPKHGPRLSEAEIAVLRQWIREGATWSEHWSFVPLSPPPKPEIKNLGWTRTSIDSFVLHRLESEGLNPSPAASPQEWLRRVSLDLIGLPPSLEEYSDFVVHLRIDRESAKARVVDRLLGSPHFGERWAALWLDLARYSDTFGFEKDPHREIWPWRDWVIRAFNNDLPFDQFTLKQLAGDQLPQPSPDDWLATAFHRNTQNNTEGGTDDEEYRMAAVLDRVNTTWTTWQATTFGCTQCHAHPYDPFPHQDYYRFVAFFNNSEDCDQNDDFPKVLFSLDPDRRDQTVQLQRETRRLREALNADGLETVAQITDWKPWIPSEAKASGGSLVVDASGIISTRGTIPITVQYTLAVPAVSGMTAIKIRILPDSMDLKRAPERGQAFSKLRLSWVIPGQSNQPIAFAEVIADHLAGPRDPNKVLEGDGGFGSYPVMAGPREGVLLLEKPLKVSPDGTLQLTLDHGIAANSGVQACALRKFTLWTSTDTRLTTLANSPTRQNTWTQWRAALAKLKDVEGVRVPVMIERSPSASRETRTFIRGNRLTLDEVVQPGVPEVLKPKSIDSPGSRLEMAQWLIHPENPLTARVLANRLWAELFGRGIVVTVEDFGATGAKPSHPELLDHLALRLQGEFGWSIKRFLRELALSSTYAQSSRIPADLAERDPQNLLLARGPRSRLSAEMVRDHALAVAGVLSRKQYGPPVYPPQPEGIWNTVYSSAKWETSSNDDRFRRAIYTYNRRTSGYPMFLTFDSPTRDSCVARRIPSNTPLQALTTWNDPAFMEMAQSLATRMDSNAGTTREKIARGCRQITLEDPPTPMIDSLIRLFDGALEEYRRDPESSKKLGDTPERAALTLVANTLLNLDISLTR